MSLNLTHKIMLGFAALVLSILIVGGGGLLGNSNIYDRLNQITSDTLPILKDSFNQMIALQQANQQLYITLAESDSELVEQSSQTFLSSLDLFESKLQELAPGWKAIRS